MRKGISEHSNGRMENRSVYDNLFMLQAIIDYNKKHSKYAYILIMDTTNYFGRLLLNDICHDESKI